MTNEESYATEFAKRLSNLVEDYKSYVSMDDMENCFDSELDKLMDEGMDEDRWENDEPAGLIGLDARLDELIRSAYVDDLNKSITLTPKAITEYGLDSLIKANTVWTVTDWANAGGKVGEEVDWDELNEKSGGGKLSTNMSITDYANAIANATQVGKGSDSSPTVPRISSDDETSSARSLA